MGGGLARQISMIAGEGTFTTDEIGAGAPVITLGTDAASETDLAGLNHSCDPTLGFADARTLVARRDVQPGEELTLDYATCLDDPDYLLRCHCETYRCRQLIEGTDWQIPQLQTRYAGHWAPHVQARIDRHGAAPA